MNTPTDCRLDLDLELNTVSSQLPEGWQLVPATVRDSFGNTADDYEGSAALLEAQGDPELAEGARERAQAMRHFLQSRPLIHLQSNN